MSPFATLVVTSLIFQCGHFFAGHDADHFTFYDEIGNCGGTDTTFGPVGSEQDFGKMHFGTWISWKELDVDHISLLHAVLFSAGFDDGLNHLDLFSDKGAELNLFEWPELESNQRHKDFQSSALPTELSGRDGQRW